MMMALISLSALELRSTKFKILILRRSPNETYFAGAKFEDFICLGIGALVQSIELRAEMLSCSIEPTVVTEDEHLSSLFQLRLDLNCTKWIPE